MCMCISSDTKSFFGGGRWLTVLEPLGGRAVRDLQARDPRGVEICSGRQPTMTSAVPFAMGCLFRGSQHSFADMAFSWILVKVFGQCVCGCMDEEEFFCEFPLLKVFPLLFCVCSIFGFLET